MANYLYIVVLAVCFYDSLLMLLLPSSATFILGTDGSAARLVSNCAAIVISMFVASVYGFKKLPNIWAGWLLIFIIFSSFHCPSINFESAFTPKDPGLFNFKPMFECLLYFCLFMAISTIPLTSTQSSRINLSFAWVAVIYSVYIIFQKLGLDQIYKITGDLNHLSRNPEIGGFLSQPVFAAALLVICLPFVFKRMYKFIPLVLAAIALTGNRSAMLAAVILSLYFYFPVRRLVLIAIVAYIVILALSMGFYLSGHKQFMPFHDSGRFEIWKSVFFDFLHPAFPGVHKSYVLTGLGIGSFSVLFPFYHQAGWNQAHNEYLETFYTLSLIGLVLFSRMIADVFKTVKDDCIFMALAGIGICAFTNAVWHIPQLAFLTVFLMGLAYNKEHEYVVGNNDK